ncbi:MAG: RAD55 family ATPase [Candidatus Baldrarchaeia archaeon]
MERGVPDEIVEFFTTPGNYALLVKGKPGTGKTIFSLECLKEFADEGCGFYFSTRVDPDALLKQYPHVKEYLPHQNIIDAVRTPIPHTAGLHEILNYASIPDFLRGLYDHVSKLGSERNIVVVVDSLDAVCEVLDYPMQKFMHTFSDFVRKMGIKSIIVTEHETVTKLDYLTDGVVRLDYELIDGRLYREMYIEKLRAVKIRNPVIPFSLKDGRFTLPKRFKFPSPETIMSKINRTMRMLSSTQRNDRTFSTGSMSLDGAIGKFYSSNFVFYEVLRYVPAGVLMGLISLQVLGLLAKNVPVLLIPARYGSEEVIVNMIVTYLGKNALDRIKLLVPRTFDRNKFIQEFLNITSNLRRYNRRIGIIFATDALESTFGKDGGPLIGSQIIVEGRRHGDLIIAFSHESSMTREIFRDMADRVITLFGKHGYVFLYGTKPKTPIYNVYSDEQFDILDLGLLEIV